MITPYPPNDSVRRPSDLRKNSAFDLDMSLPTTSSCGLGETVVQLAWSAWRSEFATDGFSRFNCLLRIDPTA